MDIDNLIVRFDSDTLGYGKVRLGNPYKSGIPRGITVIAGENGSGKTTLANILEKGRYAYGNRLSFFPSDLRIRMISFSDIHSLSGMEVTYYHQRMEATMNDYVPTVAEIMERRKAPEGWIEKCAEIGLKNVAGKKVNYLSSGELRKLLIVNALLSEPDLLVLDNPYIGLDSPSRKELDASLEALRDRGISTVMLLCDEVDVPPYIDNIIYLHEG
ncbi:MAG: ATP-binding cassette domain-containing protein, partial [Muribaculaceae bacterium]|nr:ATP-binding cassette domain-containing protein [Muribaculaceae bacterium]